MSRGGDLLRLQELDSRLAHERERLAATEALLTTDPALEQLRAVARERTRERTAADAALATAEAEAETMRRRIAALDRQLYGGSVRNPQELLTMQRDLEALRARLTDHDEEQLVLMEHAEAAAAAVRDANAAVVAREQARAEGLGELSETAVALRAAVEEEERERAELIGSLPASDRSLYERLGRRLRPVVAHLQGETCGGCHMPLSPAEVRRIRVADEPTQCAECDRIVVP